MKLYRKIGEFIADTVAFILYPTMDRKTWTDLERFKKWLKKTEQKGKKNESNY